MPGFNPAPNLHGSAPGSMVDFESLIAYLATIPPDQQQRELDKIEGLTPQAKQAVITQARAKSQTQQRTLAQAVQGYKPTVTPAPIAPSTPPQGFNAGAPANAGGGFPGEMTQAQYFSYANTVLGYDAQKAYQDYAHNWRLSTHYQAASAANREDIPGGDLGRSAAQALGPTEWLQQTMQNAQGVYGPLMNFVAGAYAQTTGSTMPSSVRQQVMSRLSTLDPQVRAQLMDDMITLQQQGDANPKLADGTANPRYKLYTSAVDRMNAMIGSAGPLGSIYSAAVQSNPNAQVDAHKALIDSYFKGANMTATAADYAALSKATPEEIQQVILSKPLPDDPKVNYGTYRTVQNDMNSMYQQYFGRMPTHDELMGYMGMNADQRKQHVMASPSTQLPGETVGRYAAIKSWADSAVSQIGYGASDQVIAAAHAGMKGS